MKKGEKILRIGLVSSTIFLVGCSLNNKNIEASNYDIKNKVEYNQAGNDSVFITQEYNKDEAIIKSSLNSKYSPKKIAWKSMQEIFNLNENDYKKDYFKEKYSSYETNISERSYLEHSFDIIKNEDIGVFIGQEKGKDEWVIKIGMNDINEEYVFKYLMPVLNNMFDDKSVSKSITEESIKMLKNLDDNYSFGIIELSDDIWMLMNEKESINTTTMFELPNIYKYNIELNY